VSEQNFLSAGRFTVEKRRAYRKEGDRWVETDTEILIIRRFFGNNYSQLKVPVGEVQTLIWILEKMLDGGETAPKPSGASKKESGRK